MIFKKDHLVLGLVLGLIAPCLGLLIFILYKLKGLSIYEGFQFMFAEPGLRMFSAALTLSLLLNALIFTLYINAHRDLTARGVFFATMGFGLVVLLIKTFG